MTEVESQEDASEDRERIRSLTVSERLLAERARLAFRARPCFLEQAPAAPNRG